MRPSGGKLVCAKCGVTTASTGPTSVSKAVTKETVIVDSVKDKVDMLPTADYICEKCGNAKAFYFMRQTRSADEATTRFLECTKCGYKWREYR